MARLNGCFPKLHAKLSGWRTLAIWNIGAMILLTLLLCGFTVASILKTDILQKNSDEYLHGNSGRGDAVRNAFLFHYSSCDEPTARNINMILHLPDNAVSSAVLASSSFFSQVLSSPSRAEVDVSHARGKVSRRRSPIMAERIAFVSLQKGGLGRTVDHVTASAFALQQCHTAVGRFHKLPCGRQWLLLCGHLEPTSLNRYSSLSG
jgi:hypothetical protein